MSEIKMIWQRVKKVLHMIYSAITTIIILTALLIVISYIIGIRPYAVRTGSMSPTIPQDSICFVNQNAKFESIENGDIIAFKAGDTLVTHRAVSVEKNGIHTKGDANNSEDAVIVTKDNFVGKTIYHIQKLGAIIFIYETKWGKVSYIGGAVLFLYIGHLLEKTDRSADSKKSINTEEENYEHTKT